MKPKLTDKQRERQARVEYFQLCLDFPVKRAVTMLVQAIHPGELLSVSVLVPHARGDSIMRKKAAQVIRRMKQIGLIKKEGGSTKNASYRVVDKVPLYPRRQGGTER